MSMDKVFEIAAAPCCLNSNWLERLGIWERQQALAPLLCCRESEALAIATLVKNPLHPDPWHFEWLRDKHYPADRLTPLLRRFLEHPAVDHNTLIHISILANDEVVINWARSFGFHDVMRTWIGTLNWRDIPELSARYLKRLSDDDRPDIRRRLAELHERVYRYQHAWNPSRPISSAEAEAIFLDERELMPSQTWYVVDDAGQMIGISSLRFIGSLETHGLGWVGTLPGVDSSVHLGLLATALTAARTERWDMAVEVDEADRATLDYLRRLPLQWEPSILRLSLECGFARDSSRRLRHISE